MSVKHELARPSSPLVPDKKTVKDRISTTRPQITRKRKELGTAAGLLDNLMKKASDPRVSQEERETLIRRVMSECFIELLHAMELSIDCMSVESKVTDENGRSGTQRITVAESSADTSDYMGVLVEMVDEIGRHFMVWKDTNGCFDPMKYRKRFDDDAEPPRQVREGEDYLSDEDSEKIQQEKGNRE